MRAVVDIGSNSIKFALANEQRDALQTLSTGSWVTRLSKGLKVGQPLNPASVRQSEMALREIAEILQSSPKVEIIAVATSAVRDCGNPEVIVNLVQQTLGVKLRILNGLEEARLSLEGAAAAAQLMGGSGSVFFIDVGGASTEVGVLVPRFQAFSFQAGAVRCHEALKLDHIPVSDACWATAHKNIEDFFPQNEWQKVSQAIPANATPVAIGGSLVLAAALAGSKRVNHAGSDLGYAATLAEFEDLNERVRRMTLPQRLAIPGMQAGREDILCAGVLCLTTILKRQGSKSFFVTEWGLRHGILRCWDSLAAITGDLQ